MRGLAVAVVGSLLVHTVALAWWTARDLELPEAKVLAAATEPAPPQVATIDPPPIEVVFFDEPSNGGGGAPVPASTSDVPVKRGRIVQRGSETGAELVGPSTPSEGTSRSPYMTMRRPGDEPLEGPSGEFMEDFMNRTKPLPPPPDIPGERIGNEIADLRAKLARAGRYSPDELRAMREEIVRLNAEREAEELKPAGGGTYKTEKETFKAKVNADGSVKIEDDIGGMDKFMKEHGNDPYRANKLAYLDRTRDQRVAIGKRYREQELKKSVIYMQKNIARLWSMTTDVQKRKQGLFDLWDECSETGTPEEIAGGEDARAFVMAHIRGTVRYTPDELRALNAQRHSKQPFAP